MTDAAIEKAKGEALAAREKLNATVQDLQSRLEPKRLLDDAMTDVRARSAAAAKAAGDVARERPAMVAAAGALGVFLIAHRPLLRLGRRIFRRGNATDDAAAS